MAFEATFVCEGGRIPYTPSGADVAAGQVVDLGTFVGVATSKILDGELGTLAIEGIFEFAKYASQAINRGEVVYWDEGTNTATTTGAYGEATIGVCIAAAGANDATVQVKLVQALS